ncbi:MAG: hypothetical protein GX102_01110 [Porphyromonadaceae bacterium]|nr:hypothetical protein [Porphyromonadaceae bacterium]
MNFNIKKHILFFFLFSFIISLSKAQIENDVVLKAMKTEVERSKSELKKDSLALPFYISLLVNEVNLEYSYSTSFGKENEELLNNRIFRQGSPLILVGNYHRTQNFRGASNSFLIPLGNDETAIRTAIWMNLDETYKSAAKNYVDKMAWLKQEKQTEEEIALNDFEKRKATTLFEDELNENYNFEPIKKTSLRIGKLLTDKVKEENLVVENVRTGFRFKTELNRYYDTEGSMFKYPMRSGAFNITLSGVNNEGEDISSFRSLRMNELAKFPTTDELEKAVSEVVAEYKSKFTVEKSDDPYMGPVLLVDGQVENIARQIVNNLYTSPKTRYSNGNHYQNLPGVRVISKQLSLKIDYGKAAQHQKGVKRDLAPIDHQAVIPPDSLILIENGILKNMLTSRQPVKHFLQSNGNAKDRGQVEGVITFTGNEKYTFPEIKKMLIDEAKLQGLEYAYIINNDDKLHLKVNVETGEEIPFSASINLGQIMKTMRRVMGVDKELTSSSDGTVRYPKSLLLEDAEITVYKSNSRLKKNFVPRPEIF